jgi:hypothetical protein
MKTKLIPVLLIAASASLAAPAFASGYGPEPFYNPGVGAPSSERGQNAQTVAAEQAAANSDTAYGGVREESSNSGAHQQLPAADALYRGH